MTEVKNSLARALQKCVGNLRNGDDFSDFTVVVNDTSFKCHRFILAACSRFFYGLFQSNMNECHENRVKINDMSDTTFGLVLDSIYTGNGLLTKENIFDVWSAAIKLQIGYLIKECENLAPEVIDEYNCFDFFRFVKSCGSKESQSICASFLVSHFDNLKDTEKLLQLSFDDFYSIVDNDNLLTTAEDSVLETILKWVQYETAQHNNLPGTDQVDSNSLVDTDIVMGDTESEQASDPGITDPVTNVTTDSDTLCNTAKVDSGYTSITCENRGQYLAPLLSACRLCLVSLTCLEQVLKKYELLLAGCRDAQGMIADAIMYHLCIERRQNHWPKSATYRLSGNMKHVMVFLCLKGFKTYDLNDGSVRDLADASPNILNVTVFDNELHVIEKNRTGILSLSKYIPGKGWMLVPSTLPEIEDEPILLPHGKYLYILYPSDSSAETFILKRCECNNANLRIKRWSTCCEIDDSVDTAVGVKKYILIFVSKPNTATSTVRCYNTETEDIHTTTIDGTARNMVSFRHQDDVYLLQSGGCLRRIVVSDSVPVDFEHVSKLWDFDCELSGCVMYRNQLFVFHNNARKFDAGQHLTSLPGIADNIKMVELLSFSGLFPMVMRMVPKMDVRARGSTVGWADG